MELPIMVNRNGLRLLIVPDTPIWIELSNEKLSSYMSIT